MRPAPFEYFAPRHLEEALGLLARYGGEARALAGGQSLVPMMNMRLARPAVLVDLNRVADLGRVHVSADGAIGIGALVRQQALESDVLIRAHAPLLAEAAPLIGHLQTRARGTVGGSLAHADPAAELPACMVALGARFHLRGARGARTVAAAEFFRGLLATALEPDELLVGLEVPPAGVGAGQGLAEVARRHGDFALVGAAAHIALDEDGRCREARLVFFGVTDTPHSSRAVGALIGHRADRASTEAAGRATVEEIEPRADIHATAAYRRDVAAALGARALASAAARALASAAPRAPTPRRMSAPRRPARDAVPGPLRSCSGPHGLGGLGVMTSHRFRLTVNGVERQADVRPRLLLADLLRDELALTGTHLGCEHGACGACTVIVDGDPVRSCLMFAVQVDGGRVETVEGLAPGDPAATDHDAGQADSRPTSPGPPDEALTALHPLQEAFRARHALQCGFCTPGILMTLTVYLRRHPSPSEKELREALSGNLCRCTGYQNIVAAALDAAAALREPAPGAAR